MNNETKQDLSGVTLLGDQNIKYLLSTTLLDGMYYELIFNGNAKEWLSIGKGKPRHNPDKKQNQLGEWCQCCDIIDGKLVCEMLGPSHLVTEVCKGNPHNCCKVTYRQWAGKSDKKDHPVGFYINPQ